MAREIRARQVRYLNVKAIYVIRLHVEEVSGKEKIDVGQKKEAKATRRYLWSLHISYCQSYYNHLHRQLSGG